MAMPSARGDSIFTMAAECVAGSLCILVEQEAGSSDQNEGRVIKLKAPPRLCDSTW